MSTYRVGLFGVDGERGFCDPAAPLYVAGSEEDVENTCKILDEGVDEAAFSLDVHPGNHISFTRVWLKNGREVDPFTIITAEEIASGKYTYYGANTKNLAFDYITRLESLGKKLMTFPAHCEAGSWEAELHPQLREAITRWEIRNQKSAIYIYKGLDPYNEQFSALAPEVTPGIGTYTDGERGRIRWNASGKVIDALDTCSVMIYALEAGSHCTGQTVNDALTAQKTRPNMNIEDMFNGSTIQPNPTVAIWVTDAISAVTGCDAMMEEHQNNAANKGCTFEPTDTVLKFLAANQ